MATQKISKTLQLCSNHVQIMFKGYLSLGKVYLRGKGKLFQKIEQSPQKGTSLEEKLAETNVQALQELVTGASH